MAIPRAVEAAAKKAEELHAQLYTQQKTDDPDNQEPQKDPELAPQDPPVDQQAVAPQEPPPADPPKEDPWEHKYKIIEGKYKVEVPRLAADNRELKQKLESLTNQLEELKAKASQPAQSLISAEDREKYGDDLLDVIKRAAQEQVAAKDAEIAELKRMLGEVHQGTAKSAEVMFYDRLGQLVPDWVTVNGDENFLKWLDEYDEFTGRTRQDLLSDAESAKDADRVARFFTKWKATQEQSAATANKALEAQVVPDSNKVVKAPAGKRFFTRAEISDFYARARRGEISAKDMVAMETEIHQATIEGRIK